jgi:hypothetical protein
MISLRGGGGLSGGVGGAGGQGGGGKWFIIRATDILAAMAETSQPPHATQDKPPVATSYARLVPPLLTRRLCHTRPFSRHLAVLDLPDCAGSMEYRGREVEEEARDDTTMTRPLLWPYFPKGAAMLSQAAPLTRRVVVARRSSAPPPTNNQAASHNLLPILVFYFCTTLRLALAVAPSAVALYPSVTGSAPLRAIHYNIS